VIAALTNLFAADSGPAVHVAPAGVLQIGGLTITNSILYGWICTTLTVILLVATARYVSVHPKGKFVQFVEVGVEFIRGVVEGAFDDKKVARRYTPYFVTLFFFILFNTWLGLLPLVGEGFHVGETPLFRPFTGDLNGTFAMGALTMIVVYVASVKESGGLKHFLRHFFVGNPINPLYFVIGLLEMFTDLTRVISLSLRLFLNVAIGEMVIAVFSYLGHVAAPLSALPFTLIELGIGALQSYIFVILSVMYLAIAVNGAQAHEREHSALTEDATDVTIDGTRGGNAVRA
jgi:F-type H+-transporting ATPase subunit a